DAYDQAMPADELLESAERKVLDIAEMGITGQTFTLAQALTEAYDRIDTRQQNDQTSISGLPTGFIDLDEKTAGLQNSELIIMAARPSHGKTALAMNIARHVAVEDNQPVFVVSLEQSRIELAERLLCCQARVDSHKLRDRKSTRLNSSHVSISYAVFCLKKKKIISSSSTTNHVIGDKIN